MTTEMFTMENPFEYLLTYKFSQDHIELLFSCIRAKGGWNNNPNVLQMKYAMRKMLTRNAVSASKNANCQIFSNEPTTIIPFFHTRKHKAPLKEYSSSNSNQYSSTLEEDYLSKQLNAPITSEFLSNILFYISGFIVSKLVHKLSCASCGNCLLSHFTPATPDHDYCSMKYSEVASASAFTLYVNNGGLRIPSQSVYSVVEYSEKVFKTHVCNGDKITRECKLKEKLILNVCKHFMTDCRNKVFEDHEHENVYEESHQSTLFKLIAERFVDSCFRMNADNSI